MPGKTEPVTLTLVGRNVVAHPTSIPDTKIGDKLRFDSEDGKFEVEFTPWIFSGKPHLITDRKARTIRKTGKYKLKCSIMPTYDSTERTIYRKGDGAHGNVTG